jgi:hypothetical protein
MPAEEVARAGADAEALKPPLPLRRPVPPARYDPKTLIGKDRGQLLDVLGAPDGIREAPPATVWNYATRECTLDIYLYMDIASREFHALAYEVKKGDLPGDEDAAARCAGEIHESNLAKTNGAGGDNTGQDNRDKK